MQGKVSIRVGAGQGSWMSVAKPCENPHLGIQIDIHIVVDSHVPGRYRSNVQRELAVVICDRGRFLELGLGLGLGLGLDWPR